MPRELESPDDLLELPCTGPTSAEADLPAMLQAARDYIQANRTGRTEIWICSDLRENDWHADSGRWQTLRDSFLELPQGVRFHCWRILRRRPGNVAVRVTDVRRRTIRPDAPNCWSPCRCRGKETPSDQADDSRPVRDPGGSLGIDRRDGRSAVRAEGLPHSAGRQPRSGAGGAFRFRRTPIRPTTISISSSTSRRRGRPSWWRDDPQAAWPLELAAAILAGPGLRVHCRGRAGRTTGDVPWEQVALVLWQAPLPQGEAAQRDRRRSWSAAGRRLPSAARRPAARSFWRALAILGGAGQRMPVETWRGDQDLLAHTLSGDALPVGDLQIRRYCGLSGEFTPLAALQWRRAVVGARHDRPRRRLFLHDDTRPRPIRPWRPTAWCFYVAVQRALAAGAAVLGNTRNLVAGRPPAEHRGGVGPLAGDARAFPRTTPFTAACTRRATAGWPSIAPAAEDQAPVLQDPRVAGLFAGLDFARVDDRAGSIRSLIQEIWRLFLAAMIVAHGGRGRTVPAEAAHGRKEPPR